jgi:hypothetical protein
MLGKVFNVAAAPIDEAVTTWFPASAVKFGLEYRRLTPELAADLRNKLPEDVRTQFPNRVTTSEGWSLHVCGADDGHEYIRFDFFEDGPHYHYLHRTGPGELPVNHRIFFDPVADGPMWEWTMERMRTRLPEILRECRGEDLAGQLSPAAVEAALQAMDGKVRALRAEPA